MPIFERRIVEPRTVLDRESPGVPGTGHRHAFDVAFGQRSAHVRADVVDGRVFAPDVEDSDDRTVHGEGSAFSGGDVADFGDGLKLFHVEREAFRVGAKEGEARRLLDVDLCDRYCKRTLAVRSTRPGRTG